MKRNRVFVIAASLAVTTAITSSTLAVNGLLSPAASSPKDLALSLSDLPRGARSLVTTKLTADKTDEFDDSTNGLVFSDGTSMVQNYVDGFRADFMVPLGTTSAAETTSGASAQAAFDAAAPKAYVLSFVYRFADSDSATREYDRFTQTYFAPYVAPLSQSQDGNRRMVIYKVGDDSKLPGVTMQWQVLQQDEYLFILNTPGSATPSVVTGDATSSSNSSYTADTAYTAENYNASIAQLNDSLVRWLNHR